jgi:hypothetical protein
MASNVSPPRRWRLVAAVLMLFGFVLPISKCSYGDPPKTTYAYVVPEALAIGSCEDQRGVSAQTKCYLTEGPALNLSLALIALLWPVAVIVIARKEKTRRATWIRRICELLLIAGSALWLYVEVILASAASGWYVASAGVGVYLAAWAREVVPRIVGAARSRWARAAA